jgi:hypothetical protein
MTYLPCYLFFYISVMASSPFLCSLCRGLSRNANYTKPASTDSTSDSSDGGAGYKKGSMDSNDKTRDKLTYLQRILNARVYDIAIDTPLEPAPVISARCDPFFVFFKHKFSNYFLKVRASMPSLSRLSHASLSPHLKCEITFPSLDYTHDKPLSAPLTLVLASLTPPPTFLSASLPPYDHLARDCFRLSYACPLQPLFCWPFTQIFSLLLANYTGH